MSSFTYEYKYILSIQQLDLPYAGIHSYLHVEDLNLQ